MKQVKYEALRKLVRSKFDTQAEFANKMGMHPVTLSIKLHGNRDWTREEIAKAAELLEIPYDQLNLYFFLEENVRNRTEKERTYGLEKIKRTTWVPVQDHHPRRMHG